MQRILLSLLLLGLLLCSSCDSTEPERISSPSYSIPDGVYALEQSISLECNTAGSAIYFTLDGSEPDINSSLYSEPLILQDIIPVMLNRVTISARSYRIDLGYSPTCAATFTVHYANSVESLDILPDDGEQMLGAELTITAEPDDAKIYYTLDGSEPRPGVNLYNGPLHLSEPGLATVKAIACKEGWNPLGPVCRTYSVPLPPLPMVFVQGGEFINNGTAEEISSFHIDKYEVQQNNYYSVMGATLFPDHKSERSAKSNYPVYYVSWFNAIEYCNRRSILEGYAPCYSYQTAGNTNPCTWPEGWDQADANHENLICDWDADGYRLPTELEWMWAARGGLATHNWSYSGHEWIDPCGWYDRNSGYSVHALGMKVANELGIFDMTGNLNEWCWDNYNSADRKGHRQGKEPQRANMKLLKGGSYYVDSLACVISYRAGMSPSDVNSPTVGLRVVRRQ